MQKLVVKTAVKTALIIMGILVVAFAVFNFAFPQHMATAMESLGNYGMAVKYANLRYMYTNDCFDLARCYDDSVLAEDDGAIIYYAEKLRADANYDQVCVQRNSLYSSQFEIYFDYDYDVRVRSTLAVSYYNEAVKKEGEERETYTQKAIDFALEANGVDSFAFGNPLMKLSYAIVKKYDKAAAERILTALESITLSDSMGKEGANLQQVKVALNGIK